MSNKVVAQADRTLPDMRCEGCSGKHQLAYEPRRYSVKLGRWLCGYCRAIVGTGGSLPNERPNEERDSDSRPVPKDKSP